MDSDVDPALLLPSHFEEVRDRPFLKRLLEVQVDMQLADLRALLALPKADIGLTAGCNLTTTMLLCNVIAGASTLLFESSLQAIRSRHESGARFKSLLEEYFPWTDADALTGREAASLLYGEMRNPLTHNFGVGKNRFTFQGLPAGDSRTVMLAKDALDTQSTIAILRRDAPPPSPHTVFSTATAWVVDVRMLAWGTYRLLHRLLGDPWQSTMAEETAERLLEGFRPRVDPVEDGPSDGTWGPIETADDLRRFVDQGAVIVHRAPIHGPDVPAMAHCRICGALRRKAEQHLADGQGGTYWWTRDLGTARTVFRARRCLSEHHDAGSGRLGRSAAER